MNGREAEKQAVQNSGQMVYGIECCALSKQEEQRLDTTEMKIIRWSQ